MHHIYRKLYETFHGPIPRDENGRSYEIHHIDGNRNNNHILNLIALSIQDHYDVHYYQGDYGACHRISIKMRKSPEEISKIARDFAYERVKNGNHHFLGGQMQKEKMLQRVEKGIHNFLGGEIQKNRVKNRTHHLLDGTISKKTQQKLLKENKHNFQNRNGNTVLKKCPVCKIVCGSPNFKRWGHGENCVRYKRDKT